MYIYKLNNQNNVTVYELIPNIEKIYNFKKKQIEKNNTITSFYQLITSDKENQFIKECNIPKEEKINKSNPIEQLTIHRILKETPAIQNKILNDYYNGIYDKNPTIIKRISYTDTPLNNYFIITNPNININNNGYYQTDYIIRIPLILFQLQQILKDKFHEINLRSTNIDTLLDLFDIKYKGNIPLNEIKENFDNRFNNGDIYSNTIDKINKTTQLLNKSKKINKIK